MDRFEALRTFVAVADLGSFAGAARRLRLSSAAATRAVQALEADLGTPLFQRTTRSVRLTETGAVYADRCRRLLADFDDARRQARGEDGEPRGLLSVTAPVRFGQLHVLPVAEALLARHPALRLALTFVDRVTHLIEEGFDLAVRIGTLDDSGLVAVPLTAVHRIVVAAPAYLEAHGEPAAPAALKSHRLVAFDGIGSTRHWRFGGAEPVGVNVSPALTVNTADAAIACALRGGGLTQVLSYQVDDDLAAGRLRRVLAAHEPPPLPVHLIYPASRRGTPAVGAFVREARARFGSAPDA